MLDLIMKYLEEAPNCPHCGDRLTLCHAPPIHVGDGLGWDSEYLYICLNNDCSLFVNGWKYVENQYGHVGSYRHMQIPGSKETYNMMVAGKEAFTGSVVDIEALKRQNKRFRKEQACVAALDDCVTEQNLEPVLYLLLDEAANIESRKRAADLLVPLNDLSCLEPLRNHTFKNTDLEQQVNMALTTLLKNNYLRECPFCAELIKARAKVCKHCRERLDD